MLYYRVLLRSISLSSLVKESLDTTALPVCHQNLVLVFHIKLSKSCGPTQYFSQLRVRIIDALELLFYVALILRVHVLATASTGPDVSLKQPLHTAPVHIRLQDLILFLKGQRLHLIPDDLAKLWVPLVYHQELLIDKLLLVLFPSLLFFIFVYLVVIGREDLLLLLLLLFLEDIVVLPSVFWGLFVLILLLVVKVIAEVIVYEQAIVLLLLLVVDGGGVEDDIRLLLNGLQDDLLVLFVILEGRLDRSIEEVRLC